MRALIICVTLAGSVLAFGMLADIAMAPVCAASAASEYRSGMGGMRSRRGGMRRASHRRADTRRQSVHRPPPIAADRPAHVVENLEGIGGVRGYFDHTFAAWFTPTISVNVLPARVPPVRAGEADDAVDQFIRTASSASPCQ